MPVWYGKDANDEWEGSLMSEEIKARVKEQFGPNAVHYSTSAIHARGSDLDLLPALAKLTGQELVLDVATATGNTAFALARHVRQVVGVDLTPEMLAVARSEAQGRGLTNVSFQEGDAEHLPFPDHSFDLVICRIAAHHFPDVAAFCRESARLLRPGGRLLVVDNVVPETKELDRFINDLEQLRDPSHVRALRLSEWRSCYEQAGLSFTVAHQFPSRVETDAWLARMSAPAEVAAEVRRRLATAPPEAREHFGIDESGFTLHKAILLGQPV